MRVSELVCDWLGLCELDAVDVSVAVCVELAVTEPDGDPDTDAVSVPDADELTLGLCVCDDVRVRLLLWLSLLVCVWVRLEEALRVTEADGDELVDLVLVAELVPAADAEEELLGVPDSLGVSDSLGDRDWVVLEVWDWLAEVVALGVVVKLDD